MKIQSEINQLNQVIAMQEGPKGANEFDYELVKVVKDEGEQKKDQQKEEVEDKKQAEEKPEAKVEAKAQIHDVKEQEKDEDKEHTNDEVDARLLQKHKKKAHGNTQSATQVKT